MSAPSTRHVEEEPPPKLVEVSERIFAYVQLYGGWGLNNAGVIALGDGVTAIDTCFTERRARAFGEAVRSVSEAPVRTLINTHHHGDHTYGNFVFSPEATIIGHDLCRTEMIQTGLGTKMLWSDVDWGDIRIEPPFVTFEQHLNVYAGDLKVELIHVGPAHTTNDIVAWIPERKLLFTGDVIFNGGTPFLLMGSLAGSLEALGALRKLDPETIVPGHGEVCGPEVIDRVEEYLRFVEKTARSAFDAGTSPLEAAKSVDLGPFAELLDSERLVANIHRAFSELKGEPIGTPLPTQAVIGEMIAYNGGKLPRCLA